jgi:PAS domain S-box-containing protein
MSEAKVLTETVGTIEVLHVDDESNVTDLTATFLEREDDRFAVETATTADKGLERIDDRQPDCIVSDYNMPGMNGLEFLEAVRERYPDLPFILFTGKGSEAIASDAISAGVTDYLQKGAGTERYELLANRIRNAVRARHEAQRVDRQQQLMRLTEFAGDTGGWELDRESDTVLLTAGARRVIGRPDQAELSLEEAIALFHPDDREDIRQTLTRAFETGEELQDTWRLRPGDGDERLIDMTITPIVESGGRVTKLRGAGHDITDRRERRQALETYETVIESLTDAVYVLDEEGRFTYVNDELVELVGYDREKILGSTPALIKDGDAVERAEQELGRLLSSDGPETVTFEVTLQPRDCDPITCEDHMGVLPYEGDQFDGSVGTLRDITDRKQRARELERQNARLEDFATVVSHDLRNPLTTARGSLELAQADCDSVHLDTAGDAVDRCQALVEDLLTLARGGNAVGSPEPVTLSELAEECWETTPSADAALAAETDLTISADRSRFQQLLENLFRNAVEHGGRDVTVTVDEMRDGFCVVDDGAGIAGEERADIFEPGHSSTSGGTGLGLTIVKRIAEAHGWTVSVTDGPDGGTRFEFVVSD